MLISYEYSILQYSIHGVACNPTNITRVFRLTLLVLQELKKALERHPKYAHRAKEEWRDAIERIHENLWPGGDGHRETIFSMGKSQPFTKHPWCWYMNPYITGSFMGDFCR